MKLERVECGNCGWAGYLKPGQLVQCPMCKDFAAFQPGPKKEATRG